MREKETLMSTDWALWKFRWVFLLLAPSLGYLVTREVAEPSAFLPLLFFGIGYNLLLTPFLYFKLLPRFVLFLALALDALFCLALTFVTGGSTSPLAFCCLFPVITAALRLGQTGGLATSLAIAAAYGLFLPWESLTHRQADPFLWLLNSLLLLSVALLCLFLKETEMLIPLRRQAQKIRELQKSREKAQIIYEMAGILSATLNYERLLNAMLEVGTFSFKEIGRPEGMAVGIIFLFEGKGKESKLYVASSKGLTKQEGKIRIKGKAGLVGRALKSAEPAVGGNLAHDPELKAFPSLHSCASGVCIPLRAGFELYGAALFASTSPNAYTWEDVQLLTAFCNQSVIALQNARLYQTLRAERDKIIDVEEETRKRLARDLHDGPTQTIAALAMRLNYVKLLLQKEPKRARKELEELEAMAHRATKEIRNTLFALRPVILETQGLVAALEHYIQRIEGTGKPQIHLDTSRMRERVSPSLEEVTFFIVEEALSNARKHADAEHIWVRLRVEDEHLVAEVEDDGCGFDLEEVESSYERSGSLGLLSMKERATLVDGELIIESRPGRGTRVTFIAPLIPHTAPTAGET